MDSDWICELTDDDAPAVMNLCRPARASHGDREAAAVLVLGVCGLRYGELAALRVADVDLLRGRLLVRRTVQEFSGVTPGRRAARPCRGHARVWGLS